MRRRSFAAPFVVVIACGAPRGPAAPEPDEPIHANPPPVTVYRAARPDEVAPPSPPSAREQALTDWAHREVAGTPPSPPPYPADVCRDPAEAYARWHVSCNPPPVPPVPPDECADPARAYREHGTLCNPPSPIIATGPIINLDVQGAETIVTFALGTRDGIDRGDHAVLLDGAGHPVRGGEFVVVRANKNAAIGKVKIAYDRVPHDGKVQVRHEE